MSNPKNPAPEAITEAGAVELAESELDNVSGGPIYMKVDGIKADIKQATGNVANNVTIKFAQGKIDF